MSEESTIEKLVAKRSKAKAQPRVDTRSQAEKEIDEAVDRSAIRKERDVTRKKIFKRGIIVGVVLLLSYGIHLLFKPFQGTMAFGICKTYVELNVRFPETVYISDIEAFPASVRLWYVQTDSFGAYRMEPIQCYFKPDPAGVVPFILDKIVIRRREIEPELVTRFNKVLPALFANPPDLTLPALLQDSLQDLQINPDAMRKPIL